MTAVAEKKAEDLVKDSAQEKKEKPAKRKQEVMRKPDTAFASITAFEDAQRMALALSKSDLVPAQYSGNIPNCLLALEMSQRLGMNPLMVMQNMYVVHGRPAWSSQFMIACINGSGHFSPLRYELSGKEGTDSRTCIAWAYDKGTGERLESPAVSIKMAKEEGWYDRKGSKWQTIPELMLRYRTATFFGRTYCPELTMGMHTVEEIKDVGEAVIVEEDDPLSPGRHERKRTKKAESDALPEPTQEEQEKADQRREEMKAQVEESEKQEREPGEDDDAEPDHSPEAGKKVGEEEFDPDACADYRELCKAQTRTPRFVLRAIEESRTKHEECNRVKEFGHIDHTDEVQCGLILTEYRRIHDIAKGK